MPLSHTGVIYDSGSEDDDGAEEICPLCDCLICVRTEPSGASESPYWQRHDKCKFTSAQIASFHKACHQCRDMSQDSLCMVCKHMRLRHLIQCLLFGDSLTRQDPLDSSITIPVKVQRIYLRLGCVRDLEERSKFCDMCRIFSRAAKEAIKQTKLSPESMCHIKMDGNESKIGGVKCNLRIRLFLERSRESLKGDRPSSYLTLNQRLVGAYFLN